ncbi:MAG TPA: NAD(P)/FAD-dependent oxidoreductase [Candidatus Dormibacteraeota bacterium]|nr:NAD(P)/FAD-dependent oxidoreductase [Candidatus Dormibacteraeota bacterium]
MDGDGWDVVVAGGGPAGLSAARTAAEGGARVLLVERESAFGIPTRTSGGSFIADLAALGVGPDLYQPVTEVRFLAPTTEAVIPFPRPVVCVLDVRALYQRLAERAAAAGVELRLRTTVTAARAEDGGVVVEARGPGGARELRARHAVDATGTAAVVTAALGMHPAYERRAVGAELDLAAPAAPPGTCWLIVGERLAPSGYAWLFPYRPGRVRLGVGVMRPDSGADPRRLLDEVLAMPELAATLRGAQPVELHAGLIPVAPLRVPMVRDGVVCVGDAASHASTLVGEGIRYALGAGEAAGRALGESVGGDPAALHRFEQRWHARHRRDFAVAYRVNRALAGFVDARWDAAVSAIADTPAWFLAASLRTDFRPRHLARLALTRPRLAARYVRAARG